jgi:hypothetical protein
VQSAFFIAAVTGVLVKTCRVEGRPEIDAGALTFLHGKSLGQCKHLTPLGKDHEYLATRKKIV